MTIRLAARERTRDDVQAGAPHRSAAPPVARDRAAEEPAGRSSVAYAFSQVRVHADPGTSLPDHVRGPLEARFGAGLGGVRVHDGPWAARAADQIGARAFTFGRDVYLGSEGRALGGAQRARLLAHEAVHALQQGDAGPTGGTVRVGGAREPAEAQAHAVADAAFGPSRSLALRDGLRAGGTTGLVKLGAPAIQRDLKDKHPVSEGAFTLNLATESHAGAKSGMSGTIAFHAADTAPDSTSIRLLQVLRLEDLTTGKDYVWTGGDANRNKTMTANDPGRGVSPGYHVDVNPAALSPRTKKTDSDVSPYYRDYWPNATSSQDGSKAGKTVADASLWDYPGWSQNCRFSFETAAKATDTGHIYGSVMWGFTVSDGAKGTVGSEYATSRSVTTRQYDEAVSKFDEYYKNKGASTAP